MFVCLMRGELISTQSIKTSEQRQKQSKENINTDQNDLSQGPGIKY